MTRSVRGFGTERCEAGDGTTERWGSSDIDDGDKSGSRAGVVAYVIVRVTDFQMV